MTYRVRTPTAGPLQEVAMPDAKTMKGSAPTPGCRRPRLFGLPLAALVAAGAASVVTFVVLHRTPLPEEVVLVSIERLFASEAGLTH
jgi:hypothetical protein